MRSCTFLETKLENSGVHLHGFKVSNVKLCGSRSETEEIGVSISMVSNATFLFSQSKAEESGMVSNTKLCVSRNTTEEIGVLFFMVSNVNLLFSQSKTEEGNAKHN